jgi:tRNA pseudouridine38-40 synthase
LPRIAVKLEYLGTRLAGSQYQAGVRTVQGELERALSIFLRRPMRVALAGRTDSGVHARAQVAHFDVDEDVVDLWRLAWAVNGILPRDVTVVAASVVPDSFHARFSALRRTYAYRILNRPQRSSLCNQTRYFVSLPLDWQAMAASATSLVGSHDFSTFKSANADTLSTVCRVERAELLSLRDGELEFWITANHFVYNMVRIIVGTLVEIGLGKRMPADLGAALWQRSRAKAGPTAPPWGLCLEAVEYPQEYGLFAREK